jgi:hypothetical protein
MPNAVLETNTGLQYMRRWGDTDFTVPGLAADEIQVPLDPGQVPAAGEPNRHYTVVAGALSLLSAPDQATADADYEAARNAQLADAQVVAAVFQNLADLPVPPPVSRAFVVVVNGPGGMPGLALSTPTGYVLFAADATHP